jgi:hypothetical protein
MYLVLGGGNFSGNDGAEPRQLLSFAVIAALAMGLINSCREVVKELPIFLRERTVGLSSGAYLASKLVCLTGLSLVQSILLSMLLVVQGSHGRGLVLSSRFMELTAVLFLAALAATAAGLWLSASVSNDAAALVLVPVLLVAQLLLTGAFLRVTDKPLLAPVAVATPAFWAFSAAASSSDMLRLEGRCSADGHSPPLPTGAKSATIACSPLWEHSHGAFLTSVLALLAQTFAYATGAFYAIRRRDPLLA